MIVWGFKLFKGVRNNLGTQIEVEGSDLFEWQRYETRFFDPIDNIQTVTLEKEVERGNPCRNTLEEGLTCCLEFSVCNRKVPKGCP